MFDFIKRNKYIVIGLIVLLAGGWGGYHYYTNSKTEMASIKTGVVTKGSLVKSISATGALSAVDNVDISSKITGRIVAVMVEENQHVNAGDVLVRLVAAGEIGNMSPCKNCVGFVE